MILLTDKSLSFPKPRIMQSTACLMGELVKMTCDIVPNDTQLPQYPRRARCNAYLCHFH